MGTEETPVPYIIVSYHGLITILFQSILEQAGYSWFVFTIINIVCMVRIFL